MENNKKAYESPEIQVIELETQSVLCQQSLGGKQDDPDDYPGGGN